MKGKLAFGDELMEKTDSYRVVRTGLGALLKEPKEGSAIPQHLEEALLPTRESWGRFKRFLNIHDPARHVDGLSARITAVNTQNRITAFLAGSLYGWPREWLGPVNISYLSYDDPVLYEERYTAPRG